MYRTSKDRRFRKNKKQIRRAFIDLTIERGLRRITISDLVERADINRMTFYAHYDTVEDVFDEFVEDMETEITNAVSEEKVFDLDHLFTLLNQLMYQEIDFFRYIAKEENCADFRSRFRQAIDRILQVDFAESAAYPAHEKEIRSSLTSVCITYAYLDWLAGAYGDLPLDAVIDVTKNMLSEQFSRLSYRKPMV